MQFQRYQKYKPSGIDWLGEIPEGWEVKRLKDVISSNEKSLSNNEDPFFELKYIDISNVGTDKLNDKPEVYYFQDAPSRARRIPRKNDVILSTVRTYLKAVYFFENIEENTICSTGFSVLTPKRILPIYLKYNVIGESFIDNVIKFSKGVSYPAINDSELTALPLFLPNKQTQTAIADYLDQHTALIDKKMILLKAKKQSYTQLKQTLINEVVTKGLDTTVDIKDSGIEWIGQIPKHWEVKRLKDLGFLYSGLSGKSGDDFHTEKNERDKPFIPFTNISNNTFIKTEDFKFVKIFENEKQNKVKKGDIFFLMSSENYEDIGKNSLLLDEVNEVYLNSFCKGFRFTAKNLYPQFINYLLLSKDFRAIMSLGGKGFIRINLSLSKVNDFQVILPPKTEQIAIANYLDEKTSKIDEIIKKIDENILALQEFRKTLINDVVTGKVKVL